MNVLDELVERKAFYGVLAATALVAGFLTAVIRAGPDSGGSDGSTIAGPGYTVLGSTEAASGTELVVVYMGSANCAWSNRDSVSLAVREIKSVLADRAEERGHAFASLGVALDWSVEEGLDHLEEFGHFDEVAAGRNWLNHAAIDYLWKDVPGRAATPQVLVLKRSIRGPDDRSPGRRYDVGDPELVVRKVGYDEITGWLAADVALPRGPDGRIATEEVGG